MQKLHYTHFIQLIPMVILLIVLIIRRRNYKPHTRLIGSPETIYRTEEEKIKFFEESGLEYGKELKFSSSCKHLKDISAKDLDENLLSFYTKVYSLAAKLAMKANNRPILYIKWIGDDVGYGVFADCDIPEDSFVIEYIGEVSEKISPEDYFAWRYPPSGKILGKRFSVSGRNYGNEARFVNDNPENPDTINLRGELLFIRNSKSKEEVSGYFMIAYFSKRFIKKDEQLFISYGSTYWNNRTAVKI